MRNRGVRSDCLPSNAEGSRTAITGERNIIGDGSTVRVWNVCKLRLKRAVERVQFFRRGVGLARQVDRGGDDSSGIKAGIDLRELTEVMNDETGGEEQQHREADFTNH